MIRAQINQRPCPRVYPLTWFKLGAPTLQVFWYVASGSLVHWLLNMPNEHDECMSLKCERRLGFDRVWTVKYAWTCQFEIVYTVQDIIIPGAQTILICENENQFELQKYSQNKNKRATNVFDVLGTSWCEIGFTSRFHMHLHGRAANLLRITESAILSMILVALIYENQFLPLNDTPYCSYEIPPH